MTLINPLLGLRRLVPIKLKKKKTAETEDTICYEKLWFSHEFKRDFIRSLSDKRSGNTNPETLLTILY